MRLPEIKENKQAGLQVCLKGWSLRFERRWKGHRNRCNAHIRQTMPKVRSILAGNQMNGGSGAHNEMFKNEV
jgi:hypothetical protein